MIAAILDQHGRTLVALALECHEAELLPIEVADLKATLGFLNKLITDVSNRRGGQKLILPEPSDTAAVTGRLTGRGEK